MRAFTKRAVALTAIGAATSAAVLISAGAASAATVTGGTITLTIDDSYIAQLAKAGVVLVPQGEASATYDNSAGTVTITFTVSGGTGSLDNYAGAVDATGSVLGFSIGNGVHAVDLTSLNFNVYNDSFDGTPSGGSDTPILDLNGDTSATIADPNQSITADQLTIDPEGASLLNAALGTNVFTANENIGTFAAAWTV
jgi:hypothetical protein